MIKCRICRTPNLDKSQYCDECGARLMNEKDEKEKNRELPDFQTQMSDAPVFQAANLTSIGIPAIGDAIREADKPAVKKDSAKGVHATLVIERGDSVGTEFTLASDESLVGRWDADNGIFPDVDLDRYDPEAKVSRRHARILHNDGQYSIEDLGSTNGTFVNRGRRLIPGNAQILSGGDEIIVGKTFLRFIIS